MDELLTGTLHRLLSEWLPRRSIKPCRECIEPGPII